MLDSFGRWLLLQTDYRIFALLALAFTLFFLLYRRLRYRSWPSVIECISVVSNVLILFSGLTVGVVFLLTKPPAVESLSPEILSIAGLVSVIALAGFVGPNLVRLFRPEVNRPPKPRQPAGDDKDRSS